MKSVVLDIKGEKAAILDNTGVVHAVADKGYKVGQVLSLSEYEIKKAEEELHKASYKASRSKIIPFGLKHMTRYTRIAAAVLALVIVGGGVTAYAAPVSTVTVEDGTNSVEYKLNVFDRVVGVETSDNADDEFKEEVSELSGRVHGMKISEAMDFTARQMESRPEGMDDGSVITVKVDGLKKGNKSFNDTVDHKVKEIRDRRMTELSDSDKDATTTDGTGVKERGMTYDLTEKPSSDAADPATDIPSEAVGTPTQSGGKDGQTKDGQIQDGELKDGQVKDGELKDGQTKDGELKDGQVKDGQLPGNTESGNENNKQGNSLNTDTGKASGVDTGNGSGIDTGRQIDDKTGSTVLTPTENMQGTPTDMNTGAGGNTGGSTGVGTNGPTKDGSFDQGGVGTGQPSDLSDSNGGGSSGVPSGTPGVSDGGGGHGATDVADGGNRGEAGNSGGSGPDPGSDSGSGGTGPGGP
ncbi:MAG: hypothetical protein K6G42_04015 [Lachnospiraceae bacterium]|nr:hypothetical protein [Lachnospiraceae bacterium]